MARLTLNDHLFEVMENLTDKNINRYIGDPAYDKKIEWAKGFQKNHNCNSCPFVKNEVDIGVGMLRDCDIVCRMEIGEILKEMEGACV